MCTCTCTSTERPHVYEYILFAGCTCNADFLATTMSEESIALVETQIVALDSEHFVEASVDNMP